MSPFDVRIETAFGVLRVVVGPGRVARLSCPVDAEGLCVPLHVRGVDVAVVAEVARVAGSWAARSYAATPVPGESRVPDGTRDLVMGAVSTALDGISRLFVERDLVEVLKARKARVDEIAAIEAEVARRQAKIQARRRSLAEAEVVYSRDEARLRGEIEALDAAPGGPGRDAVGCLPAVA